MTPLLDYVLDYRFVFENKRILRNSFTPIIKQQSFFVNRIYYPVVIVLDRVEE